MTTTSNGLPATARTPEELLSRCKHLDAELAQFRKYLQQKRKENVVEMSHYRGVVKSEVKNLQRLIARQKDSEDKGTADGLGALNLDDSDSDAEPLQQCVASSNVPFLESLWNVAKSTTGLVALQKHYYYGADVTQIKRGKTEEYSSTTKAGKVMVDVVAEDGLEWVKVSLITNHRMLMDKAREGWAESDSDDEDWQDSPRDDPDHSIPIVKICDSLLAASREVRIRTRHPRIRLVLPKVVEGKLPVVDRILQRLRSSGILVQCNSSVVSSLPLTSALDSMIPEPYSSFTRSVNIDCTILLALVSDFSHMDVTAEPWFHRALKRQVEIEEQENLLPNLLYPAIVGRKLVCTQEAAKRMREIVATIGTPSEKARTAIFMGSEEGIASGNEREDLAKLTKFDVPNDLTLPVRIVDKASAPWDALPAAVSRVKDGLTPINQSVFLYGWAAGITTITSNRTVVKQMETVLDEAAKSEADWPRIWLCPTARSLVGKEKGRK